MDGRRTALIVASDEFEHAGLSRLQAPSADAEALAGVLGDPDIGGFDVRVVHNSPSHTVQARVEDLFAEGRPDDLLLLHFSGHGLKSDSGELFFAATNTRPDRLASTAVSADFVQRCMRGSRARSIVLFLDCCYGGAFSEGVAVRAAGPANVLESFPAGKLGGGRGRAVITASSAMEYAFEGSALASDEQRQPSVFTSAVVEGLRSGAADRDEDGLVSLNELYDYVFDQVRAQNPNQTPSRDIELQGELYVARSHRKRVRAVPLPPDLRAAVQDDNMYTRLGAVGELRARLASADPGVSLGAREALQDVARSDTSYVAEAARDALTAVSAPTGPAHEPTAEAEARPSGIPVTVESGADTLTSRQQPAPAPSDPPEPATSSATPPLGVAPSAHPSAAATAATLLRGQSATRAATTDPATPSAVPEWPHNRVMAGRALLAGGSLVLLSVLLPAFVYGNDVFTFHNWLGVVLVVVGLLCIGTAMSTLTSSMTRRHWPWTVLTMSVVALVTIAVLRVTMDGISTYDIKAGAWVAWAGCLTSTAAGVVAVLGLRGSPAKIAAQNTTSPVIATVAADPGSEPDTTARPRSWFGASLVAMGVLVLAPLVLNVQYDNIGWFVLETSIVRLVTLGLVAVSAGACALFLRGRGPVGLGLAAGAVAPAALGFVGSFADTDVGSMQEGWYVGLVGQSGLAVVGALGFVTVARTPPSALPRPRSGISRGLAWGASVTAAGLLGLSGAQVSHSSSGLATVLLSFAALAIAVPACVERLPVIRAWTLLGWAIGAVGGATTLGSYVEDHSEPTWPIALTLGCLAALIVAALTERPWAVGAHPVGQARPSA
ncbi:caspase family protein [Pedococcus bigeumensis]|uniref:Caspase-related protein n=1 Tax=Pedococcus bigeumensis TaxID=433644 RepID=A0A502D153_9MICO|nr:caspase family protein [Pedococcus bigeumensis]TPG19535.1 caspase-related protein [Pedococcus bigeumensis]